jgi:hypothetical protein
MRGSCKGRGRESRQWMPINTPPHYTMSDPHLPTTGWVQHATSKDHMHSRPGNRFHQILRPLIYGAARGPFADPVVGKFGKENFQLLKNLLD